MGTILSRFKDIMSSNINALLDKVEDPSKMIDQYLRNLESDLGKVKSETAAVMAQEKRSKRLLDECNENIAKMQTYAEKALISGNESDARVFLDKKLELTQKLSSLESSYKMAESNSKKMKSIHDKIVEDISELNSKRQELKAKMQIAKTQEKMNSINSNIDSYGESASEFDKMEEKINERLDKANAMNELNDSNESDNIEDLMQKYDSDTSSTSSTDDELAALKDKLDL